MMPLIQEYLIPVVGLDMRLPLIALTPGANKELPFVQKGVATNQSILPETFEGLRDSAKWLISLDLCSREDTRIWLAIQTDGWLRAKGICPEDLIAFNQLNQKIDSFGLSEEKAAMLKEVYGQIFFKTAYGTLRCHLSGEML